MHVDHHNLTIIPVDASTGSFKILNGNDGGVYFSEDGGNRWASTLNGYNTTQFYGVDKKPGADIYIGGMQDNGTWRSFGNPTARSGWIPAVGGDGFDVAWHSEDDRKIVGSSQFNGIFRTVDGGINWLPATTGLTDTGQTGEGQFVTSIAKSQDEPDLLFTIGRSGVWRSTDFAGSWTLRPIPAAVWSDGGSGKVRISLANPDVVWAGYRMDGTGQMHVSTDQGLTFTPVPNPEGAPGRISGLATHPSDDQTAYVLFSVFNAPKIFRTTDLGQTWEDLSGFTGTRNGFPDVARYDLLVMPNNPDELWAGTEIGLFISTDNGATWHMADNGLPAVSIWQMRFVDGQVVVATHGRGVWSVSIPAVVANEPEPDALPERFRLSQNYPNPFNPNTTIHFDVKARERVLLRVYDVLGRVVATVVDAPYAAGRHRVVFDASALSSGVYFYSIEMGDFRDVKSMLLVK